MRGGVRSGGGLPCAHGGLPHTRAPIPARPPTHTPTLRTLVPGSEAARASVGKRLSASAWLPAQWRPSRVTAASRTLMASSCERRSGVCVVGG